MFGTKTTPEFYNCGNCKRDLKVSEYRSSQTPAKLSGTVVTDVEHE